MHQNEGYEGQFAFLHQKSDFGYNFKMFRCCEVHVIHIKGIEDYSMLTLAFNSTLFLFLSPNLPIFGLNLIFPFITWHFNIVFVVNISIYCGYSFWIGAKLGWKQISQQKNPKTAKKRAIFVIFQKNWKFQTYILAMKLHSFWETIHNLLITN